MRILFMGVLFLLVETGFCQTQTHPKDTAYIVIKSDTIPGFFNNKNFENNPRVILFRKSETEEWQEYTAKDVSAFYVFGTSFESHTVRTDFSSRNSEDQRLSRDQNIIRDSTLFLRVEVKHPIASLYQFRDHNDNLHYYSRKGDGRLEELTIRCFYRQNAPVTCLNTYWQTLKIQFGDCPGMTDEVIKDVRFTTSDFIKIIAGYISCRGGHADISHTVEQKPQRRMTIFLAPGYTKLSFSQLPGTTSGSGVDRLNGLINTKLSGLSLQAGVAMELISRLNPRFSAGGELGLRYYSLSGTGVTTTAAPSTIQHDFTISATYIKLVPAFKYTMLKWRSAPYLKGGPSLSYLVGFSSSYKWVEQFASTRTTGSGDAILKSELTTFEPGLFIGAGLNRPGVTLEVRFDYGGGPYAPVSSRYGSSTMIFSFYISFALGEHK